MNRKEFLGKIGIGAAFALTSTCLGGCYKDNAITPTGPVDFALDLTQSSNGNLRENGGYIIKDRVVVAQTETGEYVAATQLCSHEDKYKVVFKNNEWFCTDHDARFGLDGSGLNTNGSKGLTIYQTELNGDILRIFS
ncbi:MAG: nitrite reductase/ring-hydroxylating ferredoxin subunit [Polaribacter sp.]|jgi:nitrite reductase/ring-hydroxylating ferredoxin subunit